MNGDRNPLEAFEGVRSRVPSWRAGTIMSPDQQSQACDLLRECMLQVEETMPHDLALRIEAFLTQTRALGSLSVQ